MTASRSPELSEVLEGVRESAAADVRVCCVARVVRWDSSKPRECDVQPVHKRAYLNEDGDRTPEKQPVIPSVPVLYPGGGGFVITWPLQVGDEVLLVFSDDSLDKYLQVGGQSDIDTEDDRRHHITDAICIPGMGKLNQAINVSNNSMQAGTLGAACQGAVLGGNLSQYLGTPAGLPDSQLLAWLQALASAAGYAVPVPTPNPASPLESSTFKVSP